MRTDYIPARASGGAGRKLIPRKAQQLRRVELVLVGGGGGGGGGYGDIFCLHNMIIDIMKTKN